MRIGTTPTHQFVLPFDTELIKAVEIVYSQGSEIILKKTEADCTMQDKIVQTTLSQEDTFKFTSEVCVDVQIRVLDKNGTAYSSDIMRVSCRKCLSDEVLT